MCVRPEGQVGPLQETPEAGVALVGELTQAAGQQVLAVVVDELFFVRAISVRGVEALRQQEQISDPVPVLGELAAVALIRFFQTRPA